MSIYPMMPRGLFGSAMPATGNQAPQPEKPKFFGEGGAGRGIAGSIGDYLLQMSGMQPIYAPVMRDQQRSKEQQRLAEQQRRAGFDDFVQKETWKRDNLPPESANPTSLQQNYDWLMRMGNKDAAENLLKRNTDPIQWIAGPDGIPRPFSMGSAEPQVLGETLPEGWSVDGGPSLPATGGFRR